MAAWGQGKGVEPPSQGCWEHTQPVMAISDPGTGHKPIPTQKANK